MSSAAFTAQKYQPSTTEAAYLAQDVLGSLYDNIDLQNIPPGLKKEGSNWSAIFNPRVERKLNVSLVGTLCHGSVVCCVRFSADGKWFATGCNRTAQIFDTKTGVKACVLEHHRTVNDGNIYVRSVCFSPNGRYLATGAEDMQIRIWDIAKKCISRVFRGHQREIYSLEFSKDGRLIVSGSGDRTVRIWDIESGVPQVLKINEPEDVDTGVSSVAISYDGRFVAAGSLDNAIRIWNVATGILVECLRGHMDSVYSIVFTPDERGLISGSLDNTSKHWDLTALLKRPVRNGPVSLGGPSSTGSLCTQSFTGHKNYVLCVAASYDGAWVVSGSKDRTVQFWDAKTAEAQFILQGHRDSVISADLSPTGHMLVTGSGDCHAKLWSYTTI